MTLHIFESIKEAFETSTQNYNRFAKKLDSIKWDSKFFADDEFYFIKGDMTFTTPSLDPFEVTRNWMPSAIFADGSYIEF